MECVINMMIFVSKQRMPFFFVPVRQQKNY